MIKHLRTLNRDEKLMLLQAIASGEIEKDCLDESTLIAYEYQDYFLGLMIAGNQIDNKEVTIVCVGEALRAKADLGLK